MNLVTVRFSGSFRNYTYKTPLNMIPGARYKIVNDKGHNYDDTVVTCTGFYSTWDLKSLPENARTIVKAECVDAPAPRPEYFIKNIYENYEKGVIAVVWSDGDKTTLKCDKNDEWDIEKAIGLAYMKKHFNNRGCYNNEIKKWINILDIRWLNQYTKELKEMHKSMKEKYNYDAK